jgi:hypothetical protein
MNWVPSFLGLNPHKLVIRRSRYTWDIPGTLVAYNAIHDITINNQTNNVIVPLNS